MQSMQKIAAIAAIAGSFALPNVQAQGIGGAGEESGQAAGSSRPALAGVTSGGAGLLRAGERVRFRQYAIREHRATPYSFSEPVTIGTVLPPTGIALYRIPRKFGVPRQYRYAVINNLVLLVDPETHQIVELIE
jgi:Protein of unknown function (DUF1236)